MIFSLKNLKVSLQRHLGARQQCSGVKADVGDVGPSWSATISHLEQQADPQI